MNSTKLLIMLIISILSIGLGLFFTFAFIFAEGSFYELIGIYLQGFGVGIGLAIIGEEHD